MRVSIAALALIPWRLPEGVLWLARWNTRWNRFSLVGGHRETGETFRECLIREIAEELGLHADADVIVHAAPCTHMTFTAWSESAKAMTAYTMEAFEVHLIGAMAKEKVDAGPLNRWLTGTEIQEQQSIDGKPVSSTIKMVLDKATHDKTLSV